MGQESAPQLIGVGVGPGDPELITLKAVRVLRDAEVILVPATEASGDGPGRAEQIVSAAIGHRSTIVRIPFSMAERRGVGPRRRESWQQSVDTALAAFADGARIVAFATVGDPSVYSTFSYLAAGVQEARPEVAVSLIPGITAMQALAANSATPLVEGREVLCLFPHTAGRERLEAVLEVTDSVVIYKGGRRLPEVLETLRTHGRGAIIGTDVSHESEHLQTLAADSGELSPLPYFSTVFSPPHRATTGGQL